MNNTLKAIVKKHVLKYPTMTTVDLRNAVSELATILEQTVQHTLREDLKMPSRHAAMKARG